MTEEKSERGRKTPGNSMKKKAEQKGKTKK